MTPPIAHERIVQDVSIADVFQCASHRARRRPSKPVNAYDLRAPDPRGSAARRYVM